MKNMNQYEALCKVYEDWLAILDAEENGFGYAIKADKSLYRIIGSIGRKVARYEKALKYSIYPAYC